MPSRTAHFFKMLLVASFAAASLAPVCAAPQSTGRNADVIKPRLGLIQQMIDQSAQGVDGAVLDLQNMVEELPFVERGRRREARTLNTQGLAQLAGEKYSLALESFTKAKATDPADAEIANNLGYAYFKAGRLAEAEQALRETLAIAPARAAAWGNLGDVFAATGHPAQAVAAYRNAYRFSRAPAKTISYFQQQQQNDPNPQIRRALETALPLINPIAKPNNDGDRNTVVSRREPEPELAVQAPSAQPSPQALYKIARQGDAEAVKQLRQLGLNGDAAAQLFVGRLYECGCGVSQDLELAVSWYKRSSDQGHLPAIHTLAWRFSHGIGIHRNLEEAFRLYQLAAGRDYVYSQNNLAVAYSRGAGTEVNPEEAFRWFQRAATAGLTLAQLNLGRQYEVGQGTAKDPQQAFQWYLRAAQGGMAVAQFKVALALEKGKGAEVNLEQAIDWYKKSAEQGLEPSRDALKRLGALE